MAEANDNSDGMDGRVAIRVRGALCNIVKDGFDEVVLELDGVKDVEALEKQVKSVETMEHIDKDYNILYHVGRASAISGPEGTRYRVIVTKVNRG